MRRVGMYYDQGIRCLLSSPGVGYTVRRHRFCKASAHCTHPRRRLFSRNVRIVQHKLCEVGLKRDVCGLASL